MLTVRNYIEAAKRRKYEETGEEGFSLIELIIVVVILGILVAIAIPIFLNIQQQAKENAAMSVASTGATQAAAQMAQPNTDGSAKTGADVTFDNLITGEATNVALTDDTITSIDDICVTATVSGVVAQEGPGCTDTGVIAAP